MEEGTASGSACGRDPAGTLLISRDALEARLENLRGAVATPGHGLFGTGSLMWQVDRESICFLGAGLALLLQLAHPCVAQAIADHSPVKRDPFRFGPYGVDREGRRS